MIERAKTIILILLVASSILLTWQIWTYQPKYESLLPTEYVAHEGLAEKRELGELVKASMIVYHYGEELHRAAYPDMFQYTVIQGQMRDWYFYSFQEINPEQYEIWQEAIRQSQGIELIFPTGIPFSILADMFQIPTEQNLPPTNRIWIYQEQTSDELYAFFFSEEQQKITKARTGISNGELKTYLALGENRPMYEAYVFKEQDADKVYPIHYLPVEPVEIMEHQYFYQRIPIEKLIPYLFVDPTFVRQMEQREGGTFFTDGSKGLQYHQNQLSMYFFHPISESLSSNLTMPMPETYVQRSIQFVNQHQGWEHVYYLYSIDQSEVDQKMDVAFRKHVGNYPIYSRNAEEDVNVIQLGIQYDRVMGYFRPLVQVDRLMNQFPKVLPSGTELVATLEAQEFPLERITSIEVGYQSVIRDYHLNYTPYWVIQLVDGERYFVRSLGEEIISELE